MPQRRSKPCIKQEVVVGILLSAEQGVDDGGGGAVHSDQKGELGDRRRPATGDSFRPIGPACPPEASAAGGIRCFGGRLRRGLFNPAFTRILRRVVLPMTIPLGSASNSLRWEWLAPSWVVQARWTTSAVTASGVVLTGLRPRRPWARAVAPLSW